MNISNEELKFNKNNIDYEDGYRVVFLYKDNYCLGAYCKTIEGFMIDFCEYYPIFDSDDIPPFISIEDILDRYLNDYKDIIGVSIYHTNGNCVATKYRDNKDNEK